MGVYLIPSVKRGDQLSITSSARALAVLGVTIAILFATAAVALAAYGPEAPPGPPVPGGFSLVVASRTIGANGGIFTATTGSTRLRLSVPRHALAGSVQFTFTRPRLSALQNLIPKGKRLRVAFAILANRTSGQQIRGAFSRRPLSIFIINRTLTRTAQVLTWNAARHRFVRMPAVARAGQVVVTARHFGEFVVLSPK